MKIALIIVSTVLVIIVLGSIWTYKKWCETVRYYLDNLEC